MTKPIPSEVSYKIKLMQDINAEAENYRQELVSFAKDANISIVHIFDKENPKGGLTVAFRKHMPHQNSTNMVEVAVATCSTLDTFSRKIGTQYALDNFRDGRTIDLPLSSGYKYEDLNLMVKEFFSNTAYRY